MPNNAVISSLTVPVLVNGEIQNVTFDLKDAYARERLTELGSALYWIGVTTTELTDGGTTNPITVNGESVTAEVGGMAHYDGTEYVWSGSAWQEIGHANFGALAFKSSAQGSITPAGDVSVSIGDDAATGTVNSITDVGTLPSCSVSGEVLTFNAGTLPTKGADQTVVTATGTISATFTGTEATVTVE